jgi:hypothetical protein
MRWQPLLVGEPFKLLAQAKWIRAEAGGGEVHDANIQKISDGH